MVSCDRQCIGLLDEMLAGVIRSRNWFWGSTQWPPIVRVLQSGDRFMSFVRPRTLLSIVSFIDYSIHCFLLLVNIIHSLAPPDRL